MNVPQGLHVCVCVRPSMSKVTVAYVFTPTYQNIQNPFLSCSVILVGWTGPCLRGPVRLKVP